MFAAGFGEPARLPALAGLALGSALHGAAAGSGSGGQLAAPPPGIEPIAALRRVADRRSTPPSRTDPAGPGARLSALRRVASSAAAVAPVVRRRWGRSTPLGRNWIQETAADGPSGEYILAEGHGAGVQPWRGPGGRLYPDVGGGPGALAAAAPAVDPSGSAAAASSASSDPAELSGRARPARPQGSAAPPFTLPSFEGLQRPPRVKDPHYKHVNMPARLTGEMTRQAQDAAGKRTVEYLQASQNADGGLLSVNVNRDHMLSNNSISRLVKAIVPYLASSGADPAAFRAWAQALLGPDAAGLMAFDATLAQLAALPACDPATAANHRVVLHVATVIVKQLATASHNLVFGRDLENQYAGHGLDVPSYRNRIAPYAEAILAATANLRPLAQANDPGAVVDALSQSIDVPNQSYITSSTEVGGAGSYRRPIINDDLGLNFYAPSHVPPVRSHSAVGPARPAGSILGLVPPPPAAAGGLGLIPEAADDEQMADLSPRGGMEEDAHQDQGRWGNPDSDEDQGRWGNPDSDDDGRTVDLEEPAAAPSYLPSRARAWHDDGEMKGEPAAAAAASRDDGGWEPDWQEDRQQGWQEEEMKGEPAAAAAASHDDDGWEPDWQDAEMNGEPDEAAAAHPSQADLLD